MKGVRRRMHLEERRRYPGAYPAIRIARQSYGSTRYAHHHWQGSSVAAGVHDQPALFHGSGQAAKLTCKAWEGIGGGRLNLSS